MLPAARTIFGKNQLIRHRPFVFGLGIIALFADRALELNDCAVHLNLFVFIYRNIATGFLGQPHAKSLPKKKAPDQNRTGDLILTKDALYHLSYKGKNQSHFFERETGVEPATFSLEG